MKKPFGQLSPRTILAGTFVVFLGPFLMVELFPSQLDRMMDKSSYLVFHNIAEFFSIMVSLSVFSVGWYTYDQSKDRHALFLGAAFLVVGLLDFMHTLSNVAMPAFITPNSTNKSTQFWIAARLFDASAFLVSAYVYPGSQSRWLSKTPLITTALAVAGLVFVGATFFPSYVPATAVQNVGLTPLKRYLEFLVIFLLLMAWAAYWKRMAKTGDRLIIYYLAAFIICIFSEGVFASYKTGFDTYNVLGHIYKVAAFYLIYKGTFIASVNKPYVKLFDAHEDIRRLNRELEQRVIERTAQLEATNKELEAFNYSVSHDLRAPLRSIDGFSKALLEDYTDKLDENGKDCLRRVCAGSRRMDQLINDLLNLSRVSRSEMKRDRVNLSELARRLANRFGQIQPERQAEFAITDGLHVYGDERLLNLVLENLMRNAWKFTGKRDKTMIAFGVTPHDDKPAYFVKDNGAGLDMTYADKLFSPFQRLHTEDEFPGTGIGLATVRRIIEKHGGRVWIEGAPDKGATVYFTLVAADVF